MACVCNLTGITTPDYSVLASVSALGEGGGLLCNPSIRIIMSQLFFPIYYFSYNA